MADDSPHTDSTSSGAIAPAQLIGLADAAKVLGIHRSTAYEHARRGCFPVPVLRIGKLLKVNRRHLEAYLNCD